jgi:hyperosmotically inducible periplasmic protein
MSGNPQILMALGVSIFLTVGCQTNPQTTGHYIDDTAITTSVKTQLATDGALKTMTQISVKTVENTVYLTGVAPTLQAKIRAEEIARQVDGVHSVVNNLTIQP